MSGISRQTLVSGLAFALVLGLALAVTLGAARRTETPLREAVKAYAAALAAGDAAGAAKHRADLDPEPEARRAQGLLGMYWAVGAIELEEGGNRARVSLRWRGREGRPRDERQIWALEDGGRWAFVALER